MSDTPPAIGQDPWGTDLNNYLATLEARVSQFNVRSFGATGDGVTNDTPAFQSAIAALPTSGGTIIVPAGTYIVHGLILRTGVNLRGDGLDSKLLTNSGDMITISAAIAYVNLSDLWLESAGSLGGHIINVAAGGSLSLSMFQRVHFSQWFDNKSVVSMLNGEWIDVFIQGCDFQHTLSATVPTFNMISAVNGLACNTWKRCRFTFSGNYSIWLENNSASASYAYDNTIEDCNFEVCNGGAVRLLSCMNTLLSQCSIHDLSAPTTRDLFYVGKATSGAQVPSRINTFVHLARRGGTLGSGLYDLRLQSAEAQHTTVINCHTSSYPNGMIRDYGNNAVTDVGNGTIGAVNHQWSTFLQGDTTRTSYGATGTGTSASAAGLGAQWYDSTLKRPVWSDGTSWVDPTTSVRPQLLSATVAAGSTATFATITTIATLAIPARPFAATIRLDGTLFFSQTVATDEFIAYIRLDSSGGSTGIYGMEANPGSTGLNHYVHPSAMAAIPANETSTAYLQFQRVVGTGGTATVFADFRHSRIDALIVPA